MNLCIASVIQGVEAAAPWCNDTAKSQEDQACESPTKDQNDTGSEDGLELLAWQL